MSLYLKYRPQGFGSVVGQEHVIRSIQNALKHNTVHHAYLFSGPRGTGKTSLARIIAKAINCLNLKGGVEPCDECSICQNIREGRLVDLIEIDAASNRGIDEIRELREKIQFAPTQAKKKIYIIDEVHMLTKEAFNALLKTLEEPPSHAYFILATTELHKIPETILSRCQQFNFQRISTDDIVSRLETIASEESIKADLESLKLIARQSSGGLRDAIGLLEQMNINHEVIYTEVLKNLGLTGQKLIEDFFSILIQKNAKRAIEIINEINAEGQSLQQFATEWIDFLREKMLLGIQKEEDVSWIINTIEIFMEAKLAISKASISQLPLEIAVIKVCQIPKKQDKSREIISDMPRTQEEFKSLRTEKTVGEAAAAYSAATTGELSLENVRKQWQRILERIETPFIRMSFSDSEPVKLERNILTLYFNSESFREKISNPANQTVIIKVFENLFSTKIKLKLELKKIDLKPIQSKKEEVAVAPTMIEMAEEVFGIKK
ncbi:DNA polymerase III subunit gamma/tau [Candidatus Peregrinibacteria bacterium]|nr:DNA polymerase III subunit gamma/tau [Candidatus Peregrinibacteria bacterium]